MCGGIKRSKKDIEWIKPGEPLPKVYSEERELEGSIWNGFAREENLDNWISNGWKKCSIEAESFHEKGYEFSCRGIRGIYLYAGGAYRINFLTRPSTKEEEKRCHHNRMPITME